MSPDPYPDEGPQWPPPVQFDRNMPLLRVDETSVSLELAGDVRPALVFASWWLLVQHGVTAPELLSLAVAALTTGAHYSYLRLQLRLRTRRM